MLDPSTIDYIMKYNSRFMTELEARAWKHYTTTLSMKNLHDASSEMKKIWIKKGWITDNKEALALLKDGWLKFRENTALRIFKEHADKIYFNNCPQCGKLARTPFAKQCWSCSHSWRYKVVARFQLANRYENSRGKFFIVGNAIKGDITTGMKADLIAFGFHRKPEITEIRHVVHHEGDISWEDMALGFSDFSEEEKNVLKAKGAMLLIISIEE